MSPRGSPRLPGCPVSKELLAIQAVLRAYFGVPDGFNKDYFKKNPLTGKMINALRTVYPADVEPK